MRRGPPSESGGVVALGIGDEKSLYISEVCLHPVGPFEYENIENGKIATEDTRWTNENILF